MPVSGEGRKGVLIVAEAPGYNEDQQGVQLVGNAGQELTRLLFNIGVRMRRDCWLTNSVICRPSYPDGANGRLRKKRCVTAVLTCVGR